MSIAEETTPSPSLSLAAAMARADVILSSGTALGHPDISVALLDTEGNLVVYLSNSQDPAAEKDARQRAEQVFDALPEYDSGVATYCRKYTGSIISDPCDRSFDGIIAFIGVGDCNESEAQSILTYLG